MHMSAGKEHEWKRRRVGKEESTEEEKGDRDAGKQRGNKREKAVELRGRE